MMNDDRQATVHHELREGLDVVLRRLPPDYAVASQEATRLVIGRPGAFVLSALPSLAPTDVEPMAARITRLAASTRAVLADHLSWVPFIDAVVVIPPSDPPRAPVALAPIDLVDELLTTGPDTISATTLITVRELLRSNRLGVWRAGIGTWDGRIDLCDPIRSNSPI